MLFTDDSLLFRLRYPLRVKTSHVAYLIQDVYKDSQRLLVDIRADQEYTWPGNTTVFTVDDVEITEKWTSKELLCVLECNARWDTKQHLMRFLDNFLPKIAYTFLGDWPEEADTKEEKKNDSTV